MAEPQSQRDRAPTPPAPGAVPLRIALFILTVLSAVAVLFVEPALAGAVKRGAISSRWLLLPMAVYGTFFLLFAADRWRLVRAGRYPGGKAFFQIVFGLIFATLLLPSTLEHYQSVQNGGGTARLFVHPDPEVRENAVLADGFRGASPERARRVAASLDDKSPEVRRAAAQVLSRWSGKPPEDLAGIRAWATAISGAHTSTRGESSR